MVILNREKYNLLLKEARFKAKSQIKSINVSDVDSLVHRIEELNNQVYLSYLGTDCGNKEDVFKIAGMAYSWMPTMLDIYTHEETNWPLILDLIKKIKENNLDARKELVFELSKIINHSIVGTSKTLHIINPKFVPLIDSRVIRGWNSFFSAEIKDKKINNLLVDLNLDLNNKDSMLKKVNSYITYWDYLLVWKKNINEEPVEEIELRDIEVLFYIIGAREKD